MSGGRPPAQDPPASPGQYPRWRATTLGRTTERIERELVFELAGPLAGARILDAGCGDGDYSVAAARAGASVVGVDLDPAILELARRRAAAQDLDLRFEVADLRALPFADASFDLVLAVTVLCFVDDAGAAIGELARVLRPGGRLVVGELHRWSLWAAARRLRGRLGSPTWRRAHFRSAHELARLLGGAGLRVERVEGAVYYPPLRAAALALAPFDHLPRRLSTLGAAFVAAAASKPRASHDPADGPGDRRASSGSGEGVPKCDLDGRPADGRCSRSSPAAPT